MFSERNASARVGEVIADKFRLEKLIGVGAMGAVYRAVHEWTQRTVAVKLLFDSPNAAESIERFFREARAATKIGHRNIVEVLDMGQHSDGTYYLVQELLEGETLRQRLDRLTKLSPTEALEALLPVMDALAAAHAAGIVHRDVKPENIYLHAERRTTRAAKSVSQRRETTPVASPPPASCSGRPTTWRPSKSTERPRSAPKRTSGPSAWCSTSASRASGRFRARRCATCSRRSRRSRRSRWGRSFRRCLKRS
jgi:serine/threonine protein kinase